MGAELAVLVAVGEKNRLDGSVGGALLARAVPICLPEDVRASSDKEEPSSA